MRQGRGTTGIVDAATRRSASELAHHAAVGARHLDNAVRTIDECLFMVLADADLSAGDHATFAPEALADLAALLERTALEVNAVAGRLSLLGPRVVRDRTAGAAD